MNYEVELTDTYGGEANYSWVTRHVIHDPDNMLTDRQLVMKAKALLDYTGVKCDQEDYGDCIKLKPRRECRVIFITAMY